MTRRQRAYRNVHRTATAIWQAKRDLTLARMEHREAMRVWRVLQKRK